MCQLFYTFCSRTGIELGTSCVWNRRHIEATLKFQNISKVLTTGIEPATVGLLDQCSTDWATRAYNNLLFFLASAEWEPAILRNSSAVEIILAFWFSGSSVRIWYYCEALQSAHKFEFIYKHSAGRGQYISTWLPSNLCQLAHNFIFLVSRSSLFVSIIYWHSLTAELLYYFIRFIAYGNRTRVCRVRASYPDQLYKRL